ncbi:hypothetical protein CW700_01660 [Candidatus Bathyarchaeota archaeon]|nr:MAG: hypothetical protein CW700_01660 [Candidatus Bathyarchaeota archaeon]
MSEEKREKWRGDAEEVKAIFETLSTQIPKMIRGIIDSFFSPEAGTRMGKAVAEFYKNLKEAGIPEEEALAMAKDYLGTLTKWSEVLKGLKIAPTIHEKYQKREEGEKGEE